MKWLKMYELIGAILIDLMEDELFTVASLANELNVPEELVADVYTKKNQSPSCALAFGLLHLHFEKFPGLYPALNKPSGE
jgi:hypothetical protein